MYVCTLNFNSPKAYLSFLSLTFRNVFPFFWFLFNFQNLNISENHPLYIKQIHNALDILQLCHSHLGSYTEIAQLIINYLLWPLALDKKYESLPLIMLRNFHKSFSLKEEGFSIFLVSIALNTVMRLLLKRNFEIKKKKMFLTIEFLYMLQQPLTNF